MIHCTVEILLTVRSECMCVCVCVFVYVFRTVHWQTDRLWKNNIGWISTLHNSLWLVTSKLTFAFFLSFLFHTLWVFCECKTACMCVWGKPASFCLLFNSWFFADASQIYLLSFPNLKIIVLLFLLYLCYTAFQHITLNDIQYDTIKPASNSVLCNIIMINELLGRFK